jgi:putative glutamine amidotransferase
MAPGRRERDLAPQRLSMRLSYTQALQEAGAIAVVLPAHGYVDDTDALLDRLDGVLVSGGPDLDPAVYGQERHPALGSDVDRVSDEYEQALLAGAAARDLPLLGICRGLQALNVSRGGTLHQHLPDRTELGHLQRHEPFAPAHDVDVAHGSLLHWLTGRRDLAVNSFHHQAADRIGAGLEVCARAPDGTVEALWDPAARFCLGVQWHAELMTHRAEQATLLRGLVDAACGLPAQLTLAA